jgi:hypothetical protein
MTLQNTSRYLPSNVLAQDIQALSGVKAIPKYQPSRPEASVKELDTAYQEVLRLQQAVATAETNRKAAIATLKQAEWKFHNGILDMRDAVRGQFGGDSHELQTVGIKRKSNRKRPTARSIGKAVAKETAKETVSAIV